MSITLSPEELETIEDLQVRGFSLKDIAFELGIEESDLEKLIPSKKDAAESTTSECKEINNLIKKYQLGTENKKQTIENKKRTLTLMEQMRDKYFKLMNGEETEYLEPVVVLSEEDKKVVNDFLNMLEKRYLTEGRENQVVLLKLFNKLVSNVPLSYEQAIRCQGMVTSDEFKQWVYGNKEYETIQNLSATTKKNVERCIINSIKSEYRMTSDVNRLGELSHIVFSIGKKINPMSYQDLTIRIHAKISKLQLMARKNEINSIPKVLESTVTSYLGGRIGLDELDRVIDETASENEAKESDAKSFAYRSGIKQDPRKALLFKIKLYIKSDKCQMQNNEETLERIGELFGERTAGQHEQVEGMENARKTANKEAAVPIMVDHLIASKKFEAARQLVEKFEDYEAYGFTTANISNMKRKINCAQIGHSIVIRLREGRGNNAEFITSLLDFLENKKVYKSEIPLGTTQNGEAITLLSVWPDKAKELKSKKSEEDQKGRPARGQIDR